MFESLDQLSRRLTATGYLIDPVMMQVVFLAAKLQKPLLLEGPAGSGKTQLALSVAAAANTHIERLQCYRGVTEAQAIGTFDTGLQRLYMDFSKGQHEDWKSILSSLTGRDFFRPGPLMRALECEKPCVLLIDELDKVDDGFEAQAFKRAASCFGLGRYLYRISERWVDLDRRGTPKRFPALPLWALPPDVIIEHGAEPRGPIDPKLTGRIEAFRKILGTGIYTEILSRAGFSHDARLIPNANRQKDALKWMEAAVRGYERLQHLASDGGAEHLDAVLQHLKLTTVQDLPSLDALRFLVDTLESVTPQNAA